MSQKETLKIFLQDPEIRDKYGISEELANKIEMTGSHDNIMIVMIRELISKQADMNSTNIAATQLISALNNRLK
jgi:hypothetical protein